MAQTSFSADAAKPLQVSPPGGRNVALDVLRGIAILLVFGRHAPQFPHSHNPIDPILRSWLNFGWVGVDLFFVLSGFLVSGLLFSEYLKRGKLRIGRFLIRRGMKIYPAFWALLIVGTIEAFREHQAQIGRRFLLELFFLQNYRQGFFWHTWSLAVEEHFYLALALVLAWMASRGGPNPFKRIVALSIAAAVVALGLRIWTSFRWPFDLYTHIFPTHLRFDSFAFGVLLSYGYHFHHQRLSAFASRFRWLLLAGGLAAISPCAFLPISSRFVTTIGLTLLYLGFGSILLAALHFPAIGRWAVSQGLAWLGVYSYSIYLWHLLVAEHCVHLLSRFMHPTYAMVMLVYLVGSICVGVAMSLLIEMPVLRIRNWLFPSRINPMQESVTQFENASYATDEHR